MWEDSQRRHKAAVILGSWEMVTWYGIAGDEVRFHIVFLDSMQVRSPCFDLPGRFVVSPLGRVVAKVT